MESLHFLPAWPLSLDPLACFGIALFIAVSLGELAARWLRLPRITGYVVTGMLLSLLPSGPLGELRGGAHLIFELAFALLLFELGQRIDLGWLRRNPWLLAGSLGEWLLAFLAVGALMLLFQLPPLLTVLVAALAASTGPAVILGASRDSGARGQISDRLMLFSALGSCYSFVVLGLAYAWAYQEHAASWQITLLHPLYLVGGSVVLGAAAALLVLRTLARIRPGNSSQTLAAIAVIALAVALAKALDLSTVVALLFAGILSRSLDRERRLQPMDFGLLSRVALIIVFVATGTLLQAESFTTALLPAIGLLAARALGKGIGIFAFARPSGISLRKASLLSIGLLPMSGAALLWVERTASIWPEMGAQLAAIVLTALIVMEMLAPPGTAIRAAPR
ncbi:MAG: hypothetical protein CGU28_15905 [Candidatus Dactylopiibacterium carminicum]|nr:MAG: hypothetical protein CGU28_15905 [Candidatus Dactylopiibacterium carminicum]